MEKYFVEKLIKVRNFAFGLLFVSGLLLGGEAYNRNDIGDNQQQIVAVQNDHKDFDKRLHTLEIQAAHLEEFKLPRGTKPCLCIRQNVAIDQDDSKNAIFECALYPTCRTGDRANCEAVLSSGSNPVVCKSPSDW